MSGDSTSAALSALEPSYEILREIGRGGTALVYLARERATDAEVAIKLIRAKYVEDEETLARFAREARYVGQLHHPNVVALRSVVELGDAGLALVMDHVAGRTLKQAIQENGPLAPEGAESVLRDIAGALGAAHALGIVHRDVKPENIFIDEDERALLADFGVARSMSNETQLTMSGIAIGTPAYMAPEQIDGVPLDGRGDIYSLGLVGWEMLTGKRPWDGSSLYAVIYQQKHEELPDVRDLRPDIPDRLAEVIAGAIEKDRTARWQSAEELIAALDGTATRRAPRPRPMVVAQETRRFVRPATPADSGEVVVAPTALQATLRDLAVSEFERRPAETRRRLAIGAGVIASLVLVPLAIVLSTSQAGTRVPYRSSGDVEAAVQAGTPARPSGGTAPESASDAAKHAAPLDAPLPAAMVVVPPPPDNARRFVQPPSLVLEQSAEEDTVVTPPRADSVATAAAVAAVAPKAAPAPPMRVSLAAGGAHTCLVMASGKAFCWGGNDRGQLGSGGTSRLASPGAVASELRFASIASGLSHSCALTRSGAAWCWGQNDRGQLGDGTTTARPTPVPVADDHKFRVVVAGAGHSCGLDNGGRAWCWGAGAGGANGGAEPVAVATDRRFTSMAAGWAFTCALDVVGSAVCWGENSSGQLGDGTREDRRQPATVRTDVRFTAIAAGSQHACGLSAAGEAYCWGRNSRGQLGDGTRGDQGVPVRVKTTARFVAITAGAVHSCAITGDGAAYCWGQNTYGQLGDGGTTDQSQPVAVAGAHAFGSVRAFGSHTCGATASGEAFCWGYNLDGQLGDGTRVHRTRPVYVEPPTGQ
jgi:alpha-tubulin suppressor-like RCC1 family protein/tRNA A-37 threonylcarbamoyl transferase component Bud32